MNISDSESIASALTEPRLRRDWATLSEARATLSIFHVICINLHLFVLISKETFSIRFLGLLRSEDVVRTEQQPHFQADSTAIIEFLLPIFQSFSFSHWHFPVYKYLVRIMYDPVKDGICKSVLTYLLVPSTGSELRTIDRWGTLIPRFNDFEQVSGFLFSQRWKQPLIEYQKLDLLILLDYFL